MQDRTYTADAEPGDDVTVAGWVHEIRDLGGIAFLILRDTTGKIQIKFEKDEMDEDLVETGLGVSRESVVSVSGAVEEEPRAPTGVEVTPASVEVVSAADPNCPSIPRESRRRDLDPARQPDASTSGRRRYRRSSRFAPNSCVRFANSSASSAVRRSRRRRSSPPAPRAAPNCSRSRTSARRPS